jgi:hypothetical protein
VSAKQRLLDAEDRGWHELCSRLDRLSDGDWLRPGANEEWTPKDLLAHMAAWHALTTDRLEAQRTIGERPPLPDIDAFNRDQHEQSRDLTLREVRAMSGASRHRFREEIALLPDDPGDDIAQMIASNAEGHYEDHYVDLDTFLESL